MFYQRDSSHRAMSLPVVLIFLSFVVASSTTQSAGLDMSRIVNQLVSAYNEQDAAAYRESFAPRLKDEFPQEEMQRILTSNMKSHGPIVSHHTQISPDGKRALVYLKMEQKSFDVHLRISDKNQIERLTWFVHKPELEVNTLSGHERHRVQEKYQPIVDEFVRAIKDTSAEAVLSLVAEDDWTLEDYRSYLVRINARGLQTVGELEVLAHNEVLVPMYFDSSELAFYLGFDKEDKISEIRVSNYAPNDTRGLSYENLGADTIQTSDLKSFDQLRDLFNADSGKVRCIALMSPT